MPDDDEPKRPPETVKAMLVDADTQRDLERWFGLPSFQEVAERPKPKSADDDPEIVAIRERQKRVTADVDKDLLERIYTRTEITPQTLIKFQAQLNVHVDPTIAQFDEGMVDRAFTIADPREVEIPEQLRDDLKEVTPQALLRDLHRSEREFDKTFEVVDFAAEQRIDVVEAVATALRTSLRLPPLTVSPYEEERLLLEEDRARRRRPWIELPMPHRKVTE